MKKNRNQTFGTYSRVAIGNSKEARAFVLASLLFFIWTLNLEIKDTLLNSQNCLTLVMKPAINTFLTSNKLTILCDLTDLRISNQRKKQASRLKSCLNNN